MRLWNNEDTGRDKRGLFTRFLNPLYRSLTAKSTLHNGFFGAIADMFRVIEDDVNDAKKDLYLDSAEGSMLDYWGAKVGLLRKAGEEDESYRERIQKYLVVLRNTKPAIEDALKDYLGDDSAHITIYEPYVDIFYTNNSLLNGNHKLQGNYYRYAVIDVTIDRPFDYWEVKDILDKFKANGVIVYLTYNPSVNENADETTGFFDEFGIVAQQLEARYTTAFDTNPNRTLTLATTSVTNMRDHVFITNKSDLNGEDLLAGGPNTSGRPSSHGIFYGPSDYVPAMNLLPTDMVVEDGNEELPADAYTATSFQGGASVDVMLSKDKPIYMAYDLMDYLKMVLPKGYKNTSMQYVRLDLTRMSKGLDLGAITVEDINGNIVSNGSKIYLWEDGAKEYTVFTNGDSIKRPEMSDAYLFMKLNSAVAINSVAVHVREETQGTISLSEDNGEYYNLMHGPIEPLKAYEFDDIQTIGPNEYRQFIENTVSDVTFLGVVRNRRAIELGFHIFNFDTSEWERLVVSSTSGRVLLNTAVIECLDCYTNSQGTLVTKLDTSVATPTELSINYLAISLSISTGLKYSAKLGVSLVGSYVAGQFETAGLSVAPKQSQPLGELVRYPTGYIKYYIQPLEDEENNIFTLTDGQLSNDPRGFNSGKFMSNSGGAGNASITISTTSQEDPLVFSMDASGSSLSFGEYGVYEDDIISITALFNDHKIIQVEYQDYMTGNVIRESLGESSQTYTLTRPADFSYANPYGNGTDPSLMPADFFTTSKVTTEAI